MTIALLNARLSTKLARRKPTSITRINSIITTNTTTLDEDRQAMTTLRGIKEKGRRLDVLYSSLVKGPVQ